MNETQPIWKSKYGWMILVAGGLVALSCACCLVALIATNPRRNNPPIQVLRTNTASESQTQDVADNRQPEAIVDQPTASNTTFPTPTVAATSTIAPNPTSVLSGQIAYICSPDDFQICIMNPDGTNVVTVTDLPESRFPAWSPDGLQIAFSSKPLYADADIYSIGIDGSNLLRLTDHPALDSHPSWSPNGQKIVFDSTRDSADQSSPNFEIYVMNSDGSQQVRLTFNGPNLPSFDGYPAWSPDGTKIAFVSNRTGNEEIYVMNPDGNNLIQLTDNPADDSHPAWSPDGNKIAFVSDRDGNQNIYIMDSDGDNVLRLTESESYDSFPNWSPDGEWIAFSSDRDNNEEEIYILDIARGMVRRLTSNDTFDYFPVWSK